MSESDTATVISDVGRQYLRLHLTSDIGPIRLRNLINHFGSLDAVLSASRSQLERVEGIGSRIADSIFRSRSDDSVDEEINRALSCGVRIICAEDTEYPASLRNIPDPPICLYVRGHLQPTDCVAVAIVGTRRCSHYGREQAVRFGQALGGAGFTVVSGLARGIDGHAHRGALQASGRTIAVLGNGLPTIYPQEHESLADEVAAAGAIVSELPIETAPDAQNFPRRNRIIAGLALGVLVVEAGKRSGALITARLAAEYNREAFAVPGRVDRPELTAGVNGLIRDGQAKLVTCLDDLLDELAEVGEIMGRDLKGPSQAAEDVSSGTSPAVPTLAPHEQAVLDAVHDGADDAEVICSTTRLDMGRITSTLTALQLKGLVRCLPGNRFVPRGKA
jgi:DNA processing protein